MRRLFLLLLLAGFLTTYFAGCLRDDNSTRYEPTPFLASPVNWVEATMWSMSIDEKIGQVIFLSTADTSQTLTVNIPKWVAGEKIGGLLLGNQPLSGFLKIRDTVQQLADIPLFVATTETVLINNQFSDLAATPSAMTISALPYDSVKEKITNLYFEQARHLGINTHIGKQPALFKKADRSVPALNNLHTRNQHHLLSLYEPYSLQAFLTLRDTLPGYDDYLSHYRSFVEAGISGIILDPAIFQAVDFESWPDRFIRSHFRQVFGFRGLVAASLTTENCTAQLLKAGVDIFMTQYPESVFASLKEALETGELTLEQLNGMVRKVLLAKSWMRDGFRGYAPHRAISKNRQMQASLVSIDKRPANVQKFSPLPGKAMEEHFKGEKWDVNNWLLFEQSIVLLHNRDELLPFGRLYRRGFKIQQYGARPLRHFMEQFDHYANQTSYFYKTEEGEALSPLRKTNVSTWTTVITLDQLKLDAERDAAFIGSVRQLAEKNRVVLINFGDPENLQPFDTTLTVLQLFERNEMTESLAAQVLFGAIPTVGQLPVSVNSYFQKGDGMRLEPTRLKYALPQEAGIAPEKLVSINAIAKSAIDEGAMPGCQVLVAREGKIIYSESFGNHTYREDHQVQTTDLFDLASVTKVAATTLAAMKLYEEKKFNINDQLGDHLEMGNTSTIRHIPLRKLFIHESGLQPHMPVIPYLTYRDQPNAGCDSFFCAYPSEKYSVPVADSFFFDGRYQKQIWDEVYHLPVRSQRRYRYSDVNFLLIQKVLEQEAGQSLDDYLNFNFYYPLGLRYVSYNPLKLFSPGQIIPTEHDRRWRHQLVHGYVHDETAALLGGVAGHAGLFSNAEDLAVLLQMFLNGGTYGGKQYLQPETIQFFTSARHGNHRGLGFDKPRSGGGYGHARDASESSYGHTGFTGTCVWVDPDEDLVFIFLSNRVHPYTRNRAFRDKKVRERIHQVVYDALDTYVLEIPSLTDDSIKG